jgi:hypothetical protein
MPRHWLRRPGLASRFSSSEAGVSIGFQAGGDPGGRMVQAPGNWFKAFEPQA